MFTRRTTAAILFAVSVVLAAGCGASVDSSVKPLPGPTVTAPSSTTVPSTEAPSTTEDSLPPLAADGDSGIDTDGSYGDTWTDAAVNDFVDGCTGDGGATEEMCTCIVDAIKPVFTPNEVVAAQKDPSGAEWQEVTRIATSCATSSGA